MKNILKNRLKNYVKPIQNKLGLHSKTIMTQNFWSGLKSQTQPKKMSNPQKSLASRFGEPSLPPRRKPLKLTIELVTKRMGGIS